MMGRALILAAALAASTVGLPALAGEVPAVDRALSGLSAAARSFDATQRQLTAARAQSDELAHRITALKRLNTRGTDVALAQLLERSVSAEKTLALRTEARDTERKALEARVAEAVQLIDGHIRALRPDLKSADAAKRAQVAKTLKGLLADREAARAWLGRTTEGEKPLPKAWAQYEVKVEALDGPSDLREKADFVEDTRDKLKRKREALERLVADARQEREIARATVNFRTDVGLFDEQSRTGRVAKSGDRSTTLATQNEAADEAPGGGQFATAAPESPNDAFAPPAENARGAGADPDLAPGAAAAPVAPAPPAAAASPTSGGAATSVTLPKSVDPTNLLNLDLRALGAGTDVASLEALLGDLDRLERFLGERAAVIRKRAETLEADEASVLRNR